MDSACVSLYCLRCSHSSSRVEILIYLPGFASGQATQPIQPNGAYRQNKDILHKYSLDVGDPNFKAEIMTTEANK